MIENSIIYRKSKNKNQYLTLSRAEGSLIWDDDGRRYIDFTSGWNVTNLGWNHPEIAESMIEQTKRNVHGLLWGSDPVQEEYANALTSALPNSLDACVKAVSGTEAIEVSIKIARAYTKRKKIVGFKELYHGQLFASLALGYPSDSWPNISPLVPDIIQASFPHEGIGAATFEKFLFDLDNLLSKKDVAAVVTEPGIVTGWGSTLVAYPGFLGKIRELTRKYDTLLIVDEVGTGFSRTGRLFGFEYENVVPDIIALAKGMSNGASAIAAAVGRSEVFDSASADSALISTFGWTPIACAAALKTLEIHQRDKTWEMADQKGEYIKKRLREKVGNILMGVQGRGLEIGVRLKDSIFCEKIQAACLVDGLHTVVGNHNNLQLMPPLTISQELLDEGLEILISNLKIDR